MRKWMPVLVLTVLLLLVAVPVDSFAASAGRMPSDGKSFIEVVKEVVRAVKEIYDWLRSSVPVRY